jgi:hypothetical protein
MAYDPDKITYFGLTDYRGKQAKFGIRAEDRAKHVYVIGKTGMGKSNLLEGMAIQDIQDGEGIAFLDPHGQSAELLLDFIPEERIDDVVYFAPFDMENPISFNIMEDVGVDKRHLVVSGLMSAFKKIWVDAWSARMEYILNNALLALLEYPDSTLLGVNRMFADKAYRKKVVDNVTDVSVKAFWEDEYAKYSDKFATEATAAIQNKVGQFISNPLVRNIIGQPKSSFDVRDIMDKKKIMIVNLSKGLVGEANANLLGSFLITKIFLAAMSRSDASQIQMGKLPNFYLYVDEFQSFANESFAGILSEARKYKLNLTMAHQYIEQMTDEVREAVFGNVGTMITFRVGAYDADVLEKEFAPEFEAEDLVNLSRFQMYLKLMVNAVGSRPFSAVGVPPNDPPRVSYKDMVIGRSTMQFSKPRSTVEENIIRWHETGSYIAPLEKKEVITNATNRNNTNNKPPVSVNTVRPNNFARPKPELFKPRPTNNQTQTQNNTIARPDFSRSQTPDALKQNMQNISDREKKLRQAVSLDRLKSKKKIDKKSPSRQNVDELRKALSTVIKDAHSRQSENKKVTEQRTNPTPVVKIETKTEIPVKEETNNKTSNEVPEDVLRRVLDIK